MSLTFSRRRGGGLMVRSVPAVVVEPPPDPPTFVDDGSAAGLNNLVTGNATTLLMGETTGDLFVLVAASSDPAAVLGASAGTGWTSFGDQQSAGADVVARAWYGVFNGTTPANFTVDDGNESGVRVSAVVLAYRGVDQVDPIGDSDFTSTAAGTSHAGGSVTPVSTNSMIVVITVVDGDGANTWTAPAGMDERFDATLNPQGISFGAFDVVQASTDPVSKTATSSDSKAAIVITLALTPAG